MKKSLTILIMLYFSLNIALADNICGIGAHIIKDPYTKKTYVGQIINNSPASKSQLVPGMEILKINSNNTKSMTIDQILSRIKGPKGSNVTLLTKNGKDKIIITITRGIVEIPTNNKDMTFQKHWEQIAPAGYENADSEFAAYPQELLNKLSNKYIQNIIYPLSYWADREVGFRKGYSACLEYPEKEQSNCLINLTNREVNKTTSDRQAEYNEIMIKQNAIRNMQDAQRNILLQQQNYYNNAPKTYQYNINPIGNTLYINESVRY